MLKSKRIPELFVEWQSAVAIVNGDVSEAEQADAYSLQMAAEGAIVGTCPRSLVEYAMKIIVVDDCGDMSGSLTQRELVAEAYLMAGVQGWTQNNETELREWRRSIVAASAQSAPGAIG